MTANENFLNKYKNTWSQSVEYQQPLNLNNQYQVIQQAGPSYIYQDPLYSVASPNSNIRINTEITQQPASYQTVHYRINQDPNPVRIVRPITPANLKQNVRVRYLEPPTLPEPNPIIIKERQITPPPPPPPIVIRQYAKPPPTPPPLIIREKPPQQPEIPKTTIIEKIIPPPTPPPRQVILERIPAPEKPREIIYEKWLPYKPQAERPIIVEKGKIYPKIEAPKNVIIDYEHANINVQRQLIDEGIIKADPSKFIRVDHPSAELRLVDEIRDLPPASARYTPITNRPVTPKLTSSLSTSNIYIPKGPISYSGPWNTTYRSSYTGRNFGYK